MKSIRFKYLIIAVAVVTLGSCDEEFVTVTPKGAFLEESYYSNEEQATSALVGVYDILRKNTGGFENMLTVMNSGSDDFYAGGANDSDGLGHQYFSKHALTPSYVYASLWNDHYQGIYRANKLLQKLPGIPMEANLKIRFAGESKALRALYYFNLVRMFKNIPLLLTPLTIDNMRDVVQEDPKKVYAQIEKDLVEAIAVLPATVPDEELGRMTKGGAQALLGKVYLYDGKSNEATTVLAEVNGTPGGTNQYGNHLLEHFEDLWHFENEYKFNAESLIEVSHTNNGQTNWGSTDEEAYGGASEGNVANIMFGIREYDKGSTTDPELDIYPGWGFNVVTQDLHDAMQNDNRFQATILDLKELKENGTISYDAGYQGTGYFLNKFMPRSKDQNLGTGDVELNFTQNSYIIRLADTYLLEAEALGGSGARAQALLDAVRARVGMPSIPVSLDAIKNERRMELAGEGHRFFDLVRWGDAGTKLANRGFDVGTDEIFPIPFNEMQGTKMKQNPGY
jgi:hypothetical protein